MTDADQPNLSGAGHEDRFEEVYSALRSLANAYFRLQPASHTLQPTALVHEAFIRLASSSSAAPNDREHLLATASRAMRQVLVDHARKKHAIKRGSAGGARLSLSGIDTDGHEWDVLELNDSLVQLEQLDPRQARIVELRFFGGLTVGQTAEILGISERTVQLDWRMAKAWLWAELSGDRHE